MPKLNGTDFFDDVQSVKQPKCNTNKYNDFYSTIHGIITSSPVKVGFLIFILYIVINTDVFIDRFLASFSGAVEGRYATNKGIVIQAMMMTIIYLLLFLVFIN